MTLYEIHDLSNNDVIALLKHNLSRIVDPKYIENYHPDHINSSGNLFYILKEGRYRKGKGKYFVIMENDKFVCSAGWNAYTPTIALMLTRLYVAPEFRTKYYAGNYILPKSIEEAKQYKHIWITCNEHNKSIYNYFLRINANQRAALFSDWPKIYRNFVPIGQRDIYNTKQYVAEYRPNL